MTILTSDGAGAPTTLLGSKGVKIGGGGFHCEIRTPAGGNPSIELNVGGRGLFSGRLGGGGFAVNFGGGTLMGGIGGGFM